MMTARSAGEPVTASVTLSMIGWVKLKKPPGIAPFSRCDSSSMSVALTVPFGHVSYGVSATNSSFRFGP